ncbi:hypothetical protein [Burkholderia sp. BCC1993]|uniref:hypothetical protein n=1 Tax=Burkholderia sp. BCC1993 TaxID=2817444 RepID=UPI0039F08E39
MISVPPLAASTRPDHDPRSVPGYAVLAPSSHNARPWRFLVNSTTITVCTDRVRALPADEGMIDRVIWRCWRTANPPAAIRHSTGNGHARRREYAPARCNAFSMSRAV